MNRGGQSGMVIDGYTLERLIHRGSMSELWLVSGGEHAHPLVLKMPVLTHGYDPAAIVAFEVEQMILPALTGPHVPRFVASGDFTGHPHIVMEFVAGKLLRDRLADAPLDIAEVTDIGARVADALHAIHAQHVIHLDLKPSSVIFRESTSEAVLIDFGLSRHDRLPDLLAEEFELPIGTAPYIAPEQTRHVRNDLRSDIFALGVTLYHLTTGERPHGNPTTIVGLRRRLYRDPVPPRALNPSCPPWLQEVILRCLEIAPRDRYDTAAQVALALRHPDQVELTVRSQRLTRDTLPTVARRWLRAVSGTVERKRSAGDDVLRAPIILIAIDPANTSEPLAGMLRATVARIMIANPKARLACATILKTSRIGMDAETDEQGRNLHVKRLVELKHWARRLNAPEERITYHVLQGYDPAETIVRFAQSNHVDHIVIGARASSRLRRYLGSVSSQVVAEAPCSVTVVRESS
jgi:serine/threonine protein kinase